MVEFGEVLRIRVWNGLNPILGIRFGVGFINRRNTYLRSFRNKDFAPSKSVSCIRDPTVWINV